DTFISAFGDSSNWQSCIWQGFQFGSQALSITLKVDWSEKGFLYGNGFNEFMLEYSLDGGANWSIAFDHYQLGNDQINFGTFQITLPPSENVSQGRVRHYVVVDGKESPHGAELTASIANTRLEVEMDTTPPVISNVAAGGITLSNATITWNTNENSDS